MGKKYAAPHPASVALTGATWKNIGALLPGQVSKLEIWHEDNTKTLMYKVGSTGAEITGYSGLSLLWEDVNWNPSSLYIKDTDDSTDTIYYEYYT